MNAHCPLHELVDCNLQVNLCIIITNYRSESNSAWETNADRDGGKVTGDSLIFNSTRRRGMQLVVPIVFYLYLSQV